MADPNRKINLDLPSDEDSSSEELGATEISLVKEFEEEFSNRFTDEDQIFTDFCKQKAKPPPIVFPFEPFHHNNRGGYNRGRFQSSGGHRQNFNDRRGHNYHHDGGERNSYNNHYNRNRDYQPRDNHHPRDNYRDQPPHKRPREDPHPSGGGS